jgi:peptidyl-dipeptidase A
MTTSTELLNIFYLSFQYYMQYTSQPFIYRESPNPAFHEAVAHAVGLNVGGPVHLQKIGLLSSPISASSGNSMINIEYLLNVALDKLPFMAFSLSVEKVKDSSYVNHFKRSKQDSFCHFSLQWRWFVFEKGPVGMNARWWDLRLRFQVPFYHRFLGLVSLNNSLFLTGNYSANIPFKCTF